ncbi:hypothetical protein PanWU01x14_307270 [Parasponia andersonii]|uniref:Uncharacterized protein n=1 Tax=Parasponia andersonii TaxID=3476 RepID=A0A2P5ARB1_PARAD|nr:hypothetical protein PanWU01x14_307270 [Parasponia andersonii]
MKFVDESFTYLSPTITTTSWIRQDQLILNSIIALAKTSYEAWIIFTSTHAKLSRGRVFYLKGQLNCLTLSNLSISNYMQLAKGTTDELSFMEASIDLEDLTFAILNGIHTSYKGFSDAVLARETAISFDKLYEKLITAGNITK